MAEKKEGKRVPLTEEAKKLLSGIIQDSSNDVEIEYVETGNIGFDLALTNGKGIEYKIDDKIIKRVILLFTFD